MIAVHSLVPRPSSLFFIIGHIIKKREEGPGTRLSSANNDQYTIHIKQWKVLVF